LTTVVRKYNKQKKDLSHPKALSIIGGAIKVFSEKGYDNSSISDISKASKISESTLYEYFTSKEEVLFAIPLNYNQAACKKINQILPHISHPADKIRFIIRYFIEFYEQNKSYTKVALLLLRTSKEFLKKPAYELYRDLTHPIIATISEGVQQGIFRNDVSPYLVRNMILGFIEHLTIQWILLKRPEKITDQIEIVSDLIISAIDSRRKGSDRSINIKFNIDLDDLANLIRASKIREK
jgi:TetR/AcrR family transcriptional regulator, fatty acid metabolism regulator protein